MAIQKVKSTTVSETLENISEDTTPKTEEQVVEAEKSEQNTEASQDVSNSEVTEEQVTENTTSNNSKVKTVKMRMARTMAAMAVAELEPAEENALINRLTVGLQLKDSILIVNAVKKLQMSAEDVKSALETYADNVGGFLEEKSVIPTNTGSIFNQLAIGATIVDALLNYAAEKSYTADQTKYLIIKYAQEGFPATLKHIEGGAAAVSSVSVVLNTDTALTENEFVQINPMLFSGLLFETDPVTVKVTPANCTFKGLASSTETEQSAEYSFSSQTTLEALNTEFAVLQVKAIDTTDVKLSVTIDEGEPVVFEFTNVSPAAV